MACETFDRLSMSLPARARKALARLGVDTMERLLYTKRSQLTVMRQVGSKTILALDTAMAEIGVSFYPEDGPSDIWFSHMSDMVLHRELADREYLMPSVHLLAEVWETKDIEEQFKREIGQIREVLIQRAMR